MSHNFRGKVNARIQRRKKFSQDSTRNSIVMEDQHGRQWTCSTEQKSGHPTGLIAPSFKSPWRPHQKYFVINPQNVSELYIDYGRMFADAKAANATYHKKAVRVAGKKGWETPLRGVYSEDITEFMGEPPAPVEPIVAAVQENRYIIGACEGCRKFSNTCVCAGGYKAPKPDPRLIQFMQRRREELEEVTEGLDFSEKSRQKALQDAGLAEIKVGNRRVITDVENLRNMEGMNFKDDDLDGFTARGAKFQDEDRPEPVEDADVGYDDEEADETVEADQTNALEHMNAGDPMAEGLGEEVDESLSDLERQVDPAATGGKTVPPQKQELVARQAPRPETQNARRPSHGAHRSRVGGKNGKKSDRQHTMPSLRSKGDGRRSLADGAKPVTAGVED